MKRIFYSPNYIGGYLDEFAWLQPAEVAALRILRDEDQHLWDALQVAEEAYAAACDAFCAALQPPVPLTAEEEAALYALLVVQCAWCGKRVLDIMPNEDGTPSAQGDNCTTSVGQDPDGSWYAHGHYGSTKHDMHVYKFVKNAPTVEVDPVCDDCIDRKILDGDLTLVNDHTP